MLTRWYGLLPGIGSTVIGVVLGYFAMQIYTKGDWVSAILAGITIIGVILLAMAGWGMTFARSWEEPSEPKKAASDEILRVYMARQKAMLEQLDETIELLREIRDLLRGVSPGE